MGGPDAVSDNPPWTLRGRIDFLPTVRGLGSELALVTPWTRWDLAPRWGLEVYPAVQLLWRGEEPKGFLGGGGGGARITQGNLCWGDVCLLHSLELTAGYGTGSLDTPFVSGNLGILGYRFGGGDASVGPTGGLTYAGNPFPAVGVGFSIPLAEAIDLLHTDPRELDPSDFFAPVGPFQPGRVTYLYYAVELQDPEGNPLHPPIPIEDRRRLIAFDREFAFSIKESPLKGLGERVNYLIFRRPFPVRLKGPLPEVVERTGGKASEVVDLWETHLFVQRLVAAHPEFFGENVEAVAQIPYDLRDQFTWFRFDRVPSLVEAATRGWGSSDWLGFAEQAISILGDSRDGATAAARIVEAMWSRQGSDAATGLFFPPLSVPLGWHAVGGRDFRVDLAPLTDVGVPQSSVVLFHELFGHGGNRENAVVCRASDEYSEGTLEEFLKTHPREAALVRFLGQEVSLKKLADEIGKKLPEGSRGALADLVGEIEGADRETNLITLLTRANLVRRVVGKPLGHPNVLPNDPHVIDEVWGTIPGFQERLWREDSGRVPEEGDVRVVPGGFYFPDRPFVRLQVFVGGRWRDTYMKDSHAADAPLGPVMERCLEETARTILREAR